MGSSRRSLEACARASLLLLGLAGVIWSAVMLPAFWSAAPAKDVTARILADERFKSGALSDALGSMQASPELAIQRSDLPRAAALIRLRIAEEPMARKGANQADRDSAAAEESLRYVLALNPTDSFLWLMLYSIDISRNGFADTELRLLGQSYATGPMEGWISLRRNRLALAVLPVANENIQQQTILEFAKLVDGFFIEDAAINLLGVGWTERERLLASIEQVDILSREAFARRLATDGLMVHVPGVEINERWWR